jgi:hypothetical protein
MRGEEGERADPGSMLVSVMSYAFMAAGESLPENFFFNFAIDFW